MMTLGYVKQFFLSRAWGQLETPLSIYTKKEKRNNANPTLTIDTYHLIDSIRKTVVTWGQTDLGI